ncbi:hypothetical protein FBUS_03733 [Fasciolopsis buskii]|uniref:Uncharacterized protein n=1 Tax=Fasciolopsis buskii TaxID=27845 RepID=A0A8E0RLX6_9TREM|nr:hypothetical protein FBUS_03733 [Fasciolopsis buski]
MSYLGIDLGSTHNSVVICREGHTQLYLIKDPLSQTSLISPCVTYGPHGWLIGARAEAEQENDRKGVVFGIKKLLALSLIEHGQKCSQFPFELIKTGHNQISIKIGHHVIQTNQFVQIMIHTFVQWAQKQYPMDPPIREVVLNMPHHFSQTQQDLFIKCARAVGVETVHIVDDQLAAAMVYQNTRQFTEPIKVMFFNQGATSFHLSVFRFSDSEEMTELGTVDDGQTGGDEFDQRLLTHVTRQRISKNSQTESENSLSWFEILKACKQAKHDLTTDSETTIRLPEDLSEDQTTLTCSRQLFERLNADLFAYFRLMMDSLLKKSGLRRSEVTEVVLVGGSTKIPKIHDILREYFGDRVKLNDELQFPHVFVCGAILRLAKLKDLDKLQLPEQTSVDCSYQADSSLESALPISNNLLLVEPIGFKVDDGAPVIMFNADSPLPARKDWIYKTQFDYQQPSTLNVWEGDWSCSMNTTVSIGVLHCPELPPTPKETPVFRITFEIEKLGDLTVSLIDLCTKSESRLTVKQYVTNRAKRSICDLRRLNRGRMNLDKEVRAIFRTLDSPIAQLRMRNDEREELKKKCSTIYSWLTSGEPITFAEIDKKRHELLNAWLIHVPELYISTDSSSEI